MIVYTDHIEFAEKIIGQKIEWEAFDQPGSANGLKRLQEILFEKRRILKGYCDRPGLWRHMLIVKKAPQSQYDTVVDLCRNNISLPDGLLCLAGHGEKHHGLRNRSWAALPGNIHLTAHLTPNLETASVGIGFTVLSAVAVLETIDRIPGLQNRAAIKWVNDIIIDEAKVSGFLTHTLSQEGSISSAVIGIGLNVEATPEINPDRFISRVISLGDLITDEEHCSQAVVLNYLITALESGYRLLRAGDLDTLLETYRRRSLIMGREVKIMPDSPNRKQDRPVQGKVVHIGRDLELYLEGRSEPVSRGRLILIN